MRKIITIVFLLVFSGAFANSDAITDVGSMSISCSGNVEICNRSQICSEQYFYLYAYQYAYISQGILQDENHNFHMSGFLGNPKDYVVQKKVSGKHLIYSNSEFSLAIPWKSSSDGVYFSQGLGGPGDISWTLLCDSV